MSDLAATMECPECGVRCPRDVPECPSCAASLLALCGCGGTYHVLAGKCPECGRVRVIPGQGTAARRRLVFRIGVALVLVSGVSWWLYDRSLDPTRVSRGAYEDALDLANEGKHSDALVELGEAWLVQPSADIAALRASCYASIGRPVQAEVVARDGARRYPQDVRFPLLRAESAMVRGHWTIAVEHARAALQISREDASATRILARAHLALGRSADAAEAAGRLAAKTGEADDYMLVADAEEALGAPAAAERRTAALLAARKAIESARRPDKRKLLRVLVALEDNEAVTNLVRSARELAGLRSVDAIRRALEFTATGKKLRREEAESWAQDLGAAGASAAARVLLRQGNATEALHILAPWIAKADRDAEIERLAIAAAERTPNPPAELRSILATQRPVFAAVPLLVERTLLAGDPRAAETYLDWCDARTAASAAGSRAAARVALAIARDAPAEEVLPRLRMAHDAASALDPTDPVRIAADEAWKEALADLPAQVSDQAEDGDAMIAVEAWEMSRRHANTAAARLVNTRLAEPRTPYWLVLVRVAVLLRAGDADQARALLNNLPPAVQDRGLGRVLRSRVARRIRTGDQARPLLEGSAPTDVLCRLELARLHLAEKRPDAARDTLRAIDPAATTLARRIERARLLAAAGAADEAIQSLAADVSASSGPDSAAAPAAAAIRIGSLRAEKRRADRDLALSGALATWPGSADLRLEEAYRLLESDDAVRAAENLRTGAIDDVAAWFAVAESAVRTNYTDVAADAYRHAIGAGASVAQADLAYLEALLVSRQDPTRSVRDRMLDAGGLLSPLRRSAVALVPDEIARRAATIGGDRAAASAAAASILADANSELALEVRGAAALLREDVTAARTNFERLSSLDPGARPDAVREVLFGATALAMRDWDIAMRCADTAAKEDPNWLAPTVLRILARAGAGHTTEALSEGTRLSETAANASSLRLLAHLRQSYADPVDTAATLESLVALDATAGDAAVVLGGMRTEGGDHRSALRLADIAIRTRDGDADAWDLQARAALASGDMLRADQSWAAAVARRPGYANAWVRWSRSAAATRPLEGTFILARAAEVSPESVPPLTEVARDLAALGRSDRAIAYYERALAAGDESPQTAYGIATELARRGQHLDRALSLATSAWARLQSNPECADALVAVHLARREAQKAKAYVEVIVNRQGVAPDVLERSAWVIADWGDLAGALRVARRADQETQLAVRTSEQNPE